MSRVADRPAWCAACLLRSGIRRRPAISPGRTGSCSTSPVPARKAAVKLLALERIERAVGEDDAAAGLHQPRPPLRAFAPAARRASRCRPATSSTARRDGGAPCRSRSRARRAARRRRARPACKSQDIGLHDLRPRGRSRSRLRASRASRFFEASIAVTFAPASTSCAVLPPGAAQRSATRWPAMSPNSRAGRLAAASCTHQSPSAKPGSSETLAGELLDPHACRSAGRCRRAARPRASGSDFTVKSTGASTLCAARIACRLVLAIGARQPLGEPVPARRACRREHRAGVRRPCRARASAARH